MNIRSITLFLLLTAACQAASAFEVTLETKSDGKDKPSILGATNLPDAMELIVSISREEDHYFAQADAVVSDGKFVTDAFSTDGKPLPAGKYQIEITSSMTALQPKTVQAVIGDDGSHLDGRHAKESAFGGKAIDSVSSFIVP